MALGNITLRSTGGSVTTKANNVSANITGTISLNNAPLTHETLDFNFLEIAEDVATLQNATTSLNQISDVTISSATTGQVLKYNGSAWVNDTDDDTPAGYNNTNWDTAFGWGDHGSAGYLTSETSHADVLVDGDFSSAGLMKTNGSGTYSIATDNSTNWDTAYGWGNHASAGYLTSFTETFTSLVDDTPPQLGGTLDANSNEIDMGTNVITDVKVGQWDTAYTWGDHGSAGYLTAISGQSIGALSDVTITSASSNQILKYNGSAWVNQDINLNAEEDFDIRTADFNADLSTRYGIDTTSNSVTVTLPASPGTGRAIMFAQAGGDFSVNNFIIDPNGENINGSSGNYTQSTNLDFASIGVFYNGTEWRKYG